MQYDDEEEEEFISYHDDKRAALEKLLQEVAKKDGGMDEGVAETTKVDNNSLSPQSEPNVVGVSQDTPTVLLQEEVSINIDQTIPLIEDPPPLPTSPLPHSTSPLPLKRHADDDDEQLPLIATPIDK